MRTSTEIEQWAAVVVEKLRSDLNVARQELVDIALQSSDSKVAIAVGRVVFLQEMIGTILSEIPNEAA